MDIHTIVKYGDKCTQHCTYRKYNVHELHLCNIWFDGQIKWKILKDLKIPFICDTKSVIMIPNKFPIDTTLPNSLINRFFFFAWSIERTQHIFLNSLLKHLSCLICTPSSTRFILLKSQSTGS